MKKFFVILLFALSFFCFLASAQRLGRFGKSDGISYETIRTLFGLVPSTFLPSRAIDDTINYMVYLWLPDSVNEIGVRLISPVAQFISPDRGDKITEDYLGLPDSAFKKKFDPEIYLESGGGEKSPIEVFNKISHEWKLIAHNDNSSELLAQLSGEKNNSLVRVYADAKNKIRLTGGLYRIRFKAHNEKNPHGTFVLQVGVPVFLPELKLYRTAEDLQ